MKTRGTVRLATRGSTLARRQAGNVAEALEGRRHEVDLVTVETTGDQLREELLHRLGTTGAFVRDLDERVLDGDVDAAVHSMKDVPTEVPESLVTAAVPERASPADVLVTPEGSTLEALPEGAVVGTSSLRRRAQLLATRPDLEVEPLRGNVDTRIEKLLAPALQAERDERGGDESGDADGDGKPAAGGYKPTYDDNGGGADGEDGADGDDETAGESLEDWLAGLAEIERRALEREVETAYDAIVLAEAGLERSGLADQVACQRLPPTDFVPAPGQGALAVTAVDGETAETIRTAIDHPRSRVETTVERILLAELGGGCIAPVGIYAVLQGEYVHASVQALSRDGEEAVTASRDLPVETYPQAAREFAAHLADRGARELIDAASRDLEAGDGPSAGDDSTDADGDPEGSPDK